MPTFPARVHIILARSASTAVVLRRGPSKSICVLGWDRKKDEFVVGQWLRGRIYERRCDLSPDGKHFIYFAMNGKWSSEIKGSWTAISRAPYLKAIGLWSNGSCWNGGGLFMSNSAFWLNAFRFGNDERITPHGLQKLETFPFKESYGGECPGVYYHRLQRDGWKLVSCGNGDGDDDFTIFEKPLLKGWVLQKTAHAIIGSPVGKGCYFDTHALIHAKRDETQTFPNCEWADLDKERLVWVEAGILFGARITSEGLDSVRQLFDFNPIKFEAIAAPY